MNLYQYYTKEGKLKEIAADCHVDEFEFYVAVRQRFSVDIIPGTVKQKWQTTILNKRKVHDTKVAYSYPVTIGVVQ